MSGPIHQLIYCSRNGIQGDKAEVERQIQDIVTSGRRNNHALGVTGALLFTQGCFVQALEGEREALETVFEKIQCDERHRDVTVLSFETVPERAFPGWDLAFLGDVKQGATATIAAMTLNEAFRRKQAKGEHILHMMRGVVDRQAAWARA